jgi:ribosomal protein L37AE/L43A
MAIFFSAGAAAGTLIKLRCPKCGEEQARRRGQPHYRCRACGHSFTAAEGGFTEGAGSRGPRRRPPHPPRR